MPAGKPTSYATPKILWPFRQVAFLFYASSIRECGIPAAVGIRDARNLFQDGDLLDVDGYTGKVIKRHVD